MKSLSFSMEKSEKYDWIQSEEPAQSFPARQFGAGTDRSVPTNAEALLSVGFQRFEVFITEVFQIDDDWKNIQDIIRITLKELTDVVRTQGDTMRELEKQLGSKV